MKRLLFLLFTLTAFFTPPGQAQNSEVKLIELTITDCPYDNPRYIRPFLTDEFGNRFEVGYYDYDEQVYLIRNYAFSPDENLQLILTGQGLLTSERIAVDPTTAVDGVVSMSVSMKDYRKVTFALEDGFYAHLTVSHQEGSPSYAVYEDTDEDQMVSAYRPGSSSSVMTDENGELYVYALPGQHNYWGTLHRQSDNTVFDDATTHTFNVTADGDNRVALGVDPEKFCIVTFNAKGFDGEALESAQVRFGTTDRYTDETGTMRHAVLKGTSLTWMSNFSPSTAEGVSSDPLYGSVATSGASAEVTVDFSQLARTVVRLTGLSGRGYEDYYAYHCSASGYQEGRFLKEDDGTLTLTRYAKAGKRVKGYAELCLDYSTASRRQFSFVVGETPEVVLDYTDYAFVNFKMDDDNAYATVIPTGAGAGSSQGNGENGARIFLGKGNYRAVYEHYVEGYDENAKIVADFTMDGTEKTVNFADNFKDYVDLVITLKSNPAIDNFDFDLYITGEGYEKSIYAYGEEELQKKLLMKKGVYELTTEAYHDRVLIPTTKEQINLTESRSYTVDMSELRLVSATVNSASGKALKDILVMLNDDAKLTGGFSCSEQQDIYFLLPDGQYTAAIGAGGYRLLETEFTVGPETGELSFTLQDGDCYPLSIYAYDSNNEDEEIPSVRITVEGVGTLYSEYGEFRSGDVAAFLAVPVGTYNCTVSAPGYETWHGTIDVNEDEADEETGLIDVEIDLAGQYTAIEQATTQSGPAISFTQEAVKVESNGPCTLRLYDMAGRLVARTTDQSLSTADLPAGVYIANATNAQGTAHLKLIVRK